MSLLLCFVRQPDPKSQVHVRQVLSLMCQKSRTPFDTYIGNLESSIYFSDTTQKKRGERTSIWVFPKIGAPQNEWFIMENPMNKWIIWGENPLFSETSISRYIKYISGLERLGMDELIIQSSKPAFEG